MICSIARYAQPCGCAHRRPTSASTEMPSAGIQPSTFDPFVIVARTDGHRAGRRDCRVCKSRWRAVRDTSLASSRDCPASSACRRRQQCGIPDLGRTCTDSITTCGFPKFRSPLKSAHARHVVRNRGDTPGRNQATLRYGMNKNHDAARMTSQRASTSRVLMTTPVDRKYPRGTRPTGSLSLRTAASACCSNGSFPSRRDRVRGEMVMRLPTPWP